MHCYICSIETGEIVLREHKSARWLTTETLNNVEWLPADKELLKNLEQSEFENLISATYTRCIISKSATRE